MRIVWYVLWISICWWPQTSSPYRFWACWAPPEGVPQNSPNLSCAQDALAFGISSLFIGQRAQRQVLRFYKNLKYLFPVLVLIITAPPPQTFHKKCMVLFCVNSWNLHSDIKSLGFSLGWFESFSFLPNYSIKIFYLASKSRSISWSFATLC